MPNQDLTLPVPQEDNNAIAEAIQDLAVYLGHFTGDPSDRGFIDIVSEEFSRLAVDAIIRLMRASGRYDPSIADMIRQNFKQIFGVPIAAAVSTGLIFALNHIMDHINLYAPDIQVSCDPTSGCTVTIQYPPNDNGGNGGNGGP